jgi:hypothetical protein
LGFRTEEFRFPWGDALDVVMEVGRLDDAPNPRVIGDVMTSDGRPAQDASVWLLTIGNHRTDGTRTDAKGRFSFSADGGDHAVCARLPGDEAGAACQAVRVKWLGDTPAPVHLRLPKPGPSRR